MPFSGTIPIIPGPHNGDKSATNASQYPQIQQFPKPQLAGKEDSRKIETVEERNIGEADR